MADISSIGSNHESVVWQSQPKVTQILCIATYQPDTKSNPNPNPNSKPTTKQHALVNIQLRINRHTSYVRR